MGFIDLIQELRASEPSLQKAEKSMKFLGWGCLAAGVWNFIFPLIAPFKETELRFSPYYPHAALIVFSLIGTLFLLAARGIREMEPWGKRVGQGAVALLFVSGLAFMVSMPHIVQFPDDGIFPAFLAFALIITLVQFGLPTYFGIRYLDRLPVKDEMYNPVSYDPGAIARDLSARMGERTAASAVATRYKDSPFPFGIAGTFALEMATFFLGIFIGQKFAGPEAIGFLFPLLFIFIFLVPAAFNYLPSPFQENRQLVAAFSGGGSIFLFHGSWPFFRLLVYRDAVEVRVMFHRFLIPFSKMDDIPEKVGFFSTGILIKSDLPDVPSSIRFSSFGMKRIAQVVHANRAACLAAAVKTPEQKPA